MLAAAITLVQLLDADHGARTWLALKGSRGRGNSKLVALTAPRPARSLEAYVAPSARGLDGGSGRPGLWGNIVARRRNPTERPASRPRGGRRSDPERRGGHGR